MQKNCARYFDNRRYTFLLFKKAITKKAVPGISAFVSMYFLIFENGICKNTGPGILRFVCMLCFNISKGDKQKDCARYFKICNYAFSIFEKEISKKLCQVF